MFDTGSDWLVVEGSQCEDCQGNKYDPSTSQYSKLLTSETSKRLYGSASLEGKEWTD